MDQPTCGKGLAENSQLPANLGEVIAAVAEILQIHMTALDLEDDAARKERDAYRKLVKEHRIIAARLQATAEEMAGCRDLPMGKHDESAMGSPSARQAFEQLVRREQELLELLQNRAEQHKEMLVLMGAAGAGP